MNIWLRRSLTSNPYYSSAFLVARVPRETTRHRTLVQRIGRTRRVVRSDPSQHHIQDKPVSDADINAAEQVLLDPKQRMLEELFQHATEKPPTGNVRRMVEEVRGLIRKETAEQSSSKNWKWLESWALKLANEFLAEHPSPQPSLGGLELEVVPPVGMLERDKRA